MTLDYTAHRPWPLPDRPWIMSMQWHHLLFMHWAVPANALREYIPLALSIDTYDGTAWLGIVPFRMAGTRPRMLTALPWLSTFPERNV